MVIQCCPQKPGLAEHTPGGYNVALLLSTLPKTRPGLVAPVAAAAVQTCHFIIWDDQTQAREITGEAAGRRPVQLAPRVRVKETSETLQIIG